MDREWPRQPRFDVKRRGYDPDQVAEYLTRVADHVEKLEARIRTLESENERDARAQPAAASPAAASVDDVYNGVSTRVASVLRTLDEEGERLRQQARRDADAIVKQAREEADRITGNAELRRDAVRAEADRAIADVDRATELLEARRHAIAAQLHALRDKAVVLATQLGDVINPEPNAEPGQQRLFLVTSNDEEISPSPESSEPTPRRPAGNAAS